MTATLAPWPKGITKQPWKHQHEAYDYIGSLWSSGRAGAALISGMGTGKSLVATALIKAFCFKKVLLVSGTKAMIEEWPDMISEYTNGTLEAFALDGPTETRAKTLLARAKKAKPFVAVTNVESIWRGKFAEAILKVQWDLVIFDESQRIKAANSRQSKFAHRLARTQPQARRLIMTGTPIHDKPVDAYGQYRFVDARIFGTNYNAFKDEYTIQQRVKFGVYTIVGYKNLNQLAEKIHKVSFRVSDDVLDLPKLMPPTIRRVRLTEKSMRVYKKIEKDFIVDFKSDLMKDIGKNGFAVTPNILSRLTRFQQITSGFLPTFDPDLGYEVIQELGREKEIALMSLLEEINNELPVVVFARFRRDLEAIKRAAEAVGRPYLEQSGKVAQWREWRDREDNCVLGTQIQAGGAGISLVRSPYAIFYSHVYSLGDYEQAVKRIHRPGQTRRSFVYHLVARDTVDEKITAALKRKSDIAEYIVDDYRKLVLNEPS